LLGGLTADVERARRCDIIFPEGLTVVSPVPVGAESGAEILGISFFGEDGFETGRCSRVGVGGVTVVSGAVSPEFGGVLGVVIIGGTLLFPKDFLFCSIQIDLGSGGGGSSEVQDAFQLLLLLLPPLPDSPPFPLVPLVLDLVDSRSGLMFELLSAFEGLKTSLILVPGDIPLSPEPILFLLSRDTSSGAPNVLACRRAVVVSIAGADSELGRVVAVWGRVSSVSGSVSSSWALTLIWGIVEA
jgi:hypothetical protein